MNPQAKSMLAHLTPIGWVVALIVNSSKKDPITGFYLAQSLGLHICFLLTRFIPEYYIFVWGFFFVFWIYSFVGASKGEKSLIPFIGTYFQAWFGKIF